MSASQQITADIKQKDIGSFPTERQNQFTLDSSGKQLFLNFLRQQRDQHFDQFLTMLLSGRGLIILLKIDISGPIFPFFRQEWLLLISSRRLRPVREFIMLPRKLFRRF